MNNWRSKCSLPEELKDERRGPFGIFKKECRAWINNGLYTTESYQVRDGQGLRLKSFSDIEEARIYAGKKYGEYLDEQELKNKENE